MQDLHGEPCNTYIGIEAHRVRRLGLKTQAQSLLQSKLKKLLLPQNTYIFWSKRNLPSASIAQIPLAESKIKYSGSNPQAENPGEFLQEKHEQSKAAEQNF